MRNFVGVFPANHINKFINFKSKIPEKTDKYPFLTANTGSLDKDGKHWWSILDIEPKTDLSCFDSFGIDGLKSFIIHDDESVEQKILFGIEKVTRTDSKITLVNIKFLMNVCKNLNKVEIDHLSDTARDFLNFIQSFGNKLKVLDFVNLWMVEEPIHSLDTVACDIFQRYFYNNLFNPDINSKNKITTTTKKKQLKCYWTKYLF